MANRIEGHIFTRPSTKYPWDEWTDGDQWCILKGEDYFISTMNMQISLHGRAKTQQLRVKSNSFIERSRNDEGFVEQKEGLKFQFYPESS